MEVRGQLCTREKRSRPREQQRKDRGKSVPEHLRNSKEARGAEEEGARDRPGGEESQREDEPGHGGTLNRLALRMRR